MKRKKILFWISVIALTLFFVLPSFSATGRSYGGRSFSAQRSSTSSRPRTGYTSRGTSGGGYVRRSYGTGYRTYGGYRSYGYSGRYYGGGWTVGGIVLALIIIVVVGAIIRRRRNN